MLAYLAREHGWGVAREALVWLPGVVPALTPSCAAAGERAGALTHTPIYPPFLSAAKGAQVVGVPLARGRVPRDADDDGADAADAPRPTFDWAAMDAAVTPETRIFLLCSPHNPGGRIWSAEELREVAALCRRRDIILVSDEVHHDLIMPDHSHTILAKVAPEVSDLLITLVATSKTFNIAGIETGTMLIENEDLRRRIAKVRGAMNISNNRFGMLMAEAAYREGDEWLDALIPYLDANRRLMNEAIEGIPGLSVMNLEATYLAWVDFSGTGMTREEFSNRITRAGLAPS